MKQKTFLLYLLVLVSCFTRTVSVFGGCGREEAGDVLPCRNVIAPPDFHVSDAENIDFQGLENVAMVFTGCDVFTGKTNVGSGISQELLSGSVFYFQQYIFTLADSTPWLVTIFEHIYPYHFFW